VRCPTTYDVTSAHNQRYRQTDRQTDGRHTTAIPLLAIAWRGKNGQRQHLRLQHACCDVVLETNVLVSTSSPIEDKKNVLAMVLVLRKKSWSWFWSWQKKILRISSLLSSCVLIPRFRQAPPLRDCSVLVPSY